MIDNLRQIMNLLSFESEDDFYYLQILQRKKENPQLGSNSKVIKNYYVKSHKYLLDHYEEIVMLCNTFNARASLRLNKRSFEKVAYKTMVNIANSMSNREFEFIKNSYDRACGSCHNDKNKTWILDVDVKDEQLVRQISDYTETLLPSGKKTVCVIPSKSGYHVISKPFDVREFRDVFPDIEIQKDNPTNLYIP